MKISGHISTLKICLNCPMWETITFKDSGWWVPHCKCWNVGDDNKKKYGPDNSCRFFLEHKTLGNRNGFKLTSFYLFTPLVNFLMTLSKNNCVVQKRKKHLFVLVRNEYLDKHQIPDHIVQKTELSVSDAVEKINQSLLNKNQSQIFQLTSCRWNIVETINNL